MFCIKINEIECIFINTKPNIFKHSKENNSLYVWNKLVDCILNKQDLDITINNLNFKIYNNEIKKCIKIIIDNFLNVLSKNKLYLIIDGFLLYILIKNNFLNIENIHYSIYEFVKIHLPYYCENDKYILSNDKKINIDTIIVRDDLYEINYLSKEYISINGFIKIYNKDNAIELKIIDNFFDYLNERGYMKCQKI